MYNPKVKNADTPAGKGNKKGNSKPTVFPPKDDHVTILVENNATFYQCNFCQHRFKNKNFIKYHIDCKIGIKPIQCKTCRKLFFTKAKYVLHCKIHMNSHRFMCHICDKRFNRPNILKDHINSHMGLKHKCELCNATFTSRWILCKHKKVHLTEQAQPHVFQPGQNPITILKEKGRTIYECKICRKRFRTECNIKQHLAYKTGIKEFNCGLCGEGFFTNSLLESHLQKIHKDECPFKCGICGKRFPRQDHLKDHTSSHTSGLMPHICKVCNVGFDSSLYFWNHMQKHKCKCKGLNDHDHMDCHRGKGYTRKVCSKGFKQKRRVDLHVKEQDEKQVVAEKLRDEVNSTPEYDTGNVTTQEVLQIQALFDPNEIPAPVSELEGPVAEFVCIDSRSIDTINEVEGKLLTTL